MNNFYCYKISNIINDKIYIGITTDYKKRWREHRCSSKKSEKPLYRAMRKYSFDNFKMEIICIKNSWNDIAVIETKMIKKYDSANMKKGYNLSLGGEGAFGVKRTPEQVEAQKICISKWANENKKFLRENTLKQMSNPENVELSRAGAYKQWEEMSKQELIERKNRLSKESRDRWANDTNYKNKLLKKISKPIIANGIKYPSASEGARKNNIAPNTMSARCKSTKQKWAGYCFI